MLTEAIALYRSPRRAECAERSFVLQAVGIESELSRVEGEYVLWVDAGSAEAARAHLVQYEQEQRRWRWRRQTVAVVPRPPAPHALLGSALYVAVLLFVAYAAGSGLWRLDAFDRGDLDAGLVQHAQWWRAWTALTLHLDPAHIAANIAAGVWFGALAGRLLGPGHAWALIVLGAGAANLIEALLATPDHRSAGASTAVFTALGLLSAYAWVERRTLALHWAARLGPLVAGVMLLGWLGTEGEHTDVMAHLIGFGVGAVLGALAALGNAQRLLRTIPQWVTGAAALGMIALAWFCALVRP